MFTKGRALDLQTADPSLVPSIPYDPLSWSGVTREHRARSEFLSTAGYSLSPHKFQYYKIRSIVQGIAKIKPENH